MPNGVNLVTSLPFNEENYVSEYSIMQPELKVVNNLYIYDLMSNNNYKSNISHIFLNMDIQELIETPLQPSKKGKVHAKKKPGGGNTSATVADGANDTNAATATANKVGASTPAAVETKA